MALARKCTHCGYELVDLAAPNCPVCGKQVLLLPQKMSPWVGAGMQCLLGTTLIFILGFPHRMIWGFIALGLIGGIVGTFVKPKAGVPVRALQRSVARPVLFWITSVGIALCAVALACLFFLGLPMFLNSWTQWQRFEGQPYAPSFR